MQSYRKDDALKLQAFYRRNKDRRVHSDEICALLGNHSYTERHTDIRKDFECTCGEDKKTCTALEHIQSLGKGYFWYICKKIAYSDEIKPSQTVIQRPQLPQKAEMNAEARARWEAVGKLLRQPKLPVGNYGN